MKKRLFALLWSAMLLLSLAACGGSAKGGDMNSAAQTAPSATDAVHFATDEKYDMPMEEMGWESDAMPAPEPESPEGGYGGMDGSYGGVPANAKIIYTADMSLETKEFDEAQQALEDVVNELGGYFESRSVNQGGHYRSLDCTVRVPVKNFITFLDRAGETAHVTNRSEYLEDVSEAYYDQEARLATQRIKLERLQELLGKAENMADIITIESAISETELQIEYLTGSLRQYDSQINYSTVSIYLREVYRLSTDEEAPVTFGDRIASAFSSGLSSGVANLDDFAIFVARNWLSLLILIAVIAAAVLFFRRRRSRKKMAAPPLPVEKDAVKADEEQEEKK